MTRKLVRLDPVPARRYAVKMKGEAGVYDVAGWEDLDVLDVATVLADVTGFRAEYLADMIRRQLRKKANVELGDQWGGVPRWLIVPARKAAA